MAEGHALEWGQEISQESQFVDIPDGTYDFKVESLERGQHNGSDKIPPCNKMIVRLAIKMPDGSEPAIQEQFIMWSSMEWKLSQFFICIGLKKKGEPMPACNWMTEIPGRTGRCEVKKQVDRNDPAKAYTHVDKFLEPKARDWKKSGF